VISYDLVVNKALLADVHHLTYLRMYVDFIKIIILNSLFFLKVTFR